MPQIRKESRNKKIVKMREMKDGEGKHVFSFPEIARTVGLRHHSQVIKIYNRDRDIYKGDR